MREPQAALWPAIKITYSPSPSGLPGPQVPKETETAGNSAKLDHGAEAGGQNRGR